jgi:cytochrome b subunit of formate dehydrogenase
MNNLFWTVITVLFILWLLGLVLSFGGPLIYLVLMVAVILLAYNLLTRGKATL